MDRVIAVSRPIEEELLNAGIRVERLVVVDNGIDTDRFTPGDSGILRRQLGIDEDTVVIGTVGRLSKEKAHGILFEAVRKCKDSLGRVHVVCVGDGPLREELMESRGKLGLDAIVTFVGQIEDPVQYYQLFDIFVLPSLTEGMPLALLEAMACGKPAIASSVGSIPEVLSCAESGRLVPAGDVDKLTAALKDLANNADKRKTTGEKAREVVLARYSLKTQVEKYLAVYRQVAGRV